MIWVKKIVLLLGILGLMTGCIPLDTNSQNYYGSSNYQTGDDIHEQIRRAYGVKEAKGKAKWDVNYENIMY